jgi:hypothetical protein
MFLSNSRREPLLLFLLGTAAAAWAKNMNGGEYRIANAQSYDTHYQAEYFEVYSPTLKSRYSEVIWRGFDNIPLPDEVVRRFANKTMAIVGYEVDQVRIDDHGNEVPVPITHAYNHHYIAWLHNSQKGTVVKQKLHHDAPTGAMTHGTDEYWGFSLLHSTEPSSAETNPAQVFSEANGGEMRGSYHGYPLGYAQLIQGPDRFGVNPMQIDTWNRDEPTAKFVPGPLPQNAPQRGNSEATYSGLLECPCSDALVKEWSPKYKIQSPQNDDEAQCYVKGKIENATECYHAGQIVVPLAQGYEFEEIHDPTIPSGCSLKQRLDGVLNIFWSEPSTEMKEEREEPSLDEMDADGVMAFVSGAINATVQLETAPTGQATITMVGPADVWFGMGFGSLSMCRHMEADECQGGGPYAIIVYDDRMEERHLALHGPGTVLPSTLTVVSNTVTGGNRTVVLQRPMEMEDDNYYSFDSSSTTLEVILARGCSMEFAQHCGHGSATMNFLAVETNMRICRDGIDGKIGGRAFSDNRCAPFPTSTLLESNNPTCSIQTYTGGLSCCNDGKTLLDKDQEIPWADKLLEYRLKFRYYFEEYKPATATTPASHQHLVRFYWQTEAFAGEYDITACPPGTPSSQCVQVITSEWKVRDMIADRPWSQMWGTGPNSSKAEGIKLIYAGPHCHAPSCLSMELYIADTGDLLCHVEPQHGASEDVIYDELGFLAIPPCLWSDNPKDGLVAPTLLKQDTTLLSIKRNNNTFSHWGEMASWQMRGVVVFEAEESTKEHAEEVNHAVKAEASGEETSDKVVTKRRSIRRGRPEV